MCGTQHGAIDYEWLVSNLQLGDVSIGVDEEPSGTVTTFVLGPKAIYAAESYLLGLFQLYPTVYYHKATRGAEKLFSELLVRLFKLTLNGSSAVTGLSEDHPLVAFALNSDKLEYAQALDDFIFWGALEVMASAEDKVIAELATRLRDRKLLKTIEVFDDAVLSHAKLSGDEDFLDKIATKVTEILSATEAPHPEGRPKLLIDRVQRPLYREFDKTKGPLNQIMIRMRDGSLRDVATVSPVISAIGDFDGLRIYIAPDDTASRELVTAAAKEAINYARSN